MAGFGGALYVGDLHPQVTEADIFSAFSRAGQVASVRVCRDAGTRRSLGYAYVNYHSPEDADKALHLLHGTEVRWRNSAGHEQPGRNCRVMWSQRDPALRKSNVGNIHVKNLPPNVDNKTLIDHFSKWGNILSCKVVTDKEGRSLGYGFVHYDSEQAAQRAIRETNGKSFERDGKALIVSKFVPRKNREKKQEAKNFVFVRSIRGGTTEEELKAHFAQFDVHRVEIKKPAPDKMLTYTAVDDNKEAHITTVKSSANPDVLYAFVYCSSPEKAREALALHSSLFKNLRLDVLPPRESKANTAYVGCLPRTSTEASVRQIFQQWSPTKIEVRPYSPGARILAKNERKEAVELIIDDDAPIVEAEVTFETPTDLERALKLTVYQGGLQLVIDRAPQNDKLYIGSVAANTTEEELKDHVSRFARVKEIKLADCRPGSSVFFLKASDADGKPTPVLLPNGKDAPVKHGCISVASAAELIQAKTFLDRQVYKGFVLIVRPHVSSKQREKEKEQRKKERYELYLASNLYVNNLPENWTQAEVERTFSQYGKIVQTRLNTDNTGKFKGGAFVRFDSPGGATAAMENLNNKSLDGVRTLVVQPYLRREDRRRREPANRADRSNQIPQYPPFPVRPGFMGPGPQYRPPVMPRPPGPWPMAPAMSPFGYVMPQPPQAKFVVAPKQSQGYPPAIDPRQQQMRPVPNRRPNPPRPANRAQIPPEGVQLLNQISQMNPDDQKQALGSQLFVRVRAIDPERAGKITGMLLEMSQVEIVRLLFDRNALNDKVNEASNVLAQTDRAAM